MRAALVAAILLAAAPLGALAQSTGQGAGTAQGNIPQREPNLANPQAAANQGSQPPEAHNGADGTQANRVPTPTLSQPMTSTDLQRAPPHGPLPR